MKKLLLIFMFCVLIMDTYAQQSSIYEVQCKVINKSSYYDFDHRNYPYKGELQPGEIISATNIASWEYFHPEKDNKFLIYFNKDKNNFCTFPQNLVPVGTTMFFERDILTDTTTFPFFINRTRDEVILCKEMWVPVHYTDVLGSRDRETLPKHEPRLLDYNKGGAYAFYGTSEWYEINDIYTSIEDGMVIFFNPIIYTHAGKFLVKTIEKHEYGYKIECFVPRNLHDEDFPPSGLMPYFNWELCTGETVTMFLYVDGEYMDIYINGTDAQHKFGTIIKVKEEFVRQFQNLIKNGICDLTNDLFPHRADGSMDYPPPELSADTNITEETENSENSDNTAIAESAIEENARKGMIFRVIMIAGIAVLLGGGVAVVVVRRKQ